MNAVSRRPPQKKWYDEPVKKAFAIISGFLAIAAIGYSAAIIIKNIEFKMEKIELKQEFNEKLQEQINKCEAEKQQLENNRVKALEEVVLKLGK